MGDEMNVTVYGKPECVQCEHTCKQLDIAVRKGHIPGYTYLDVTTDDAANRAAKETGFTSLPIVVVSNSRRHEAWSGFKIDRIRGLRHTGDY